MIALIGNLSRDHLPGRPPRAGGGPYHGARALQRLRVPARVVVRCAQADKAELVTPVVRLGSTVRYVPGESTATFSIEYDGDHRTMIVEQLGDVWHTADLPQLPSSVRWIHIAPLARSDFPAGTLAALARRHRISFDGQGLVRVSKTGPLSLDADFDPDVLKHVWALKLADEEATVIGDVTRLPVRELLVTHGSQGATLYLGGQVAQEVPAHAIEGDPTGAGDAFMTAYLVARSTGFAPSSAARRATAVVASLLRA
ncbi:MAG TPA: PfkB family carbohydrate kinase [Casimicrobiaceae bacterium]|nr:PfkB family carbohydrate kinase [Casimicrobiaceae bacterium]